MSVAGYLWNDVLIILSLISMFQDPSNVFGEEITKSFQTQSTKSFVATLRSSLLIQETITILFYEANPRETCPQGRRIAVAFCCLESVMSAGLNSSTWKSFDEIHQRS